MSPMLIKVVIVPRFTDVYDVFRKFTNGVYIETLRQCFNTTQNRDINYVRTHAPRAT